MDKSKMAPVGVKIGVFDFWAILDYYFLAKNVLLDDFAKEFVFWSFGKFQLSRFCEIEFFVRKSVWGRFSILRKLFTWNLFQRMCIKSYWYRDLQQKIWAL